MNFTRQALADRIEDITWSIDAGISTADAGLQERAWQKLDALLADLRSPANPYNLADGEAVTAADIARQDTAAEQPAGAAS